MISENKKHFFLKRLHSLTGVALCGFILEHFFTNSAGIHALLGQFAEARETFNSHVSFLHSLPALPLIEIGALAAPFLFHIVYGIYLTFEGSSNLDHYPYERNFAYILQRLSAVVILLFLIVHVGELRFGWNLLPRAEGTEVVVSTNDTPYKYTVVEDLYVDGVPTNQKNIHSVEHNDYYKHVNEYFRNLPVFGLILYIAGIVATAFHFANGIFLAGISWGLWVRRSSQQQAFYACMGLMVVITAVGILSAFGFRELGVH